MGARDIQRDVEAMMKASFGRLPDGTARSSGIDIFAAIWSGATATGSRDEVRVSPAPTHIVTVALTDYFCELSGNGKLLRTGTWKTGRSHIVGPGDDLFAVLEGRWRMLSVYVPPSVLDAAAGRDGRSVELRDPRREDDPVLERIARELAFEIATQDPLSQLQIDGLFAGLTVQLLRRWSNVPDLLPDFPRTGGLAPSQLKRVFDAMDGQLDSQIGLDVLADIAGCSPTHFSRAFKQSTGQPPSAWMLMRRIERAKELLADPVLTLAEIALAIGFSAQPQFTTAFRRLTGTTPGAWRRKRWA